MTTCYNSALHGTISFGGLQKQWADINPNTILKTMNIVKRRLKSEMK